MSAVVGGLFYAAIPVVVKVLVVLGIGFVGYTGADFVISEAEAHILQNYNNLPAHVLPIITRAGFLDGAKMIIASYTAYIGIKTLTGAFTRMTITRPT